MNGKNHCFQITIPQREILSSKYRCNNMYSFRYENVRSIHIRETILWRVFYRSVKHPQRWRHINHVLPREAGKKLKRFREDVWRKKKRKKREFRFLEESSKTTCWRLGQFDIDTLRQQHQSFSLLFHDVYTFTAINFNGASHWGSLSHELEDELGCILWKQK